MNLIKKLDNRLETKEINQIAIFNQIDSFLKIIIGDL